MVRINCRQVFHKESKNVKINGRNFWFCFIKTAIKVKKNLEDLGNGLFRVHQKNQSFDIRQDPCQYAKVGENWIRIEPDGTRYLIGVFDINYTEMVIDTDGFVDRDTERLADGSTASVASIRFNYIPTPKTVRKNGADRDSIDTIQSAYARMGNPDRIDDLTEFLDDMKTRLLEDKDLAANKPGDGIQHVVNGTGDGITWQQGVKGEEATASQLDKVLESTHGYVLHSITPIQNHADIDHLFISTKGIFLIDTKTTKAHQITVSDGKVAGVYNGGNIIGKNKHHCEELSKAIYSLTGIRYQVNDLISIWRLDKTSTFTRKDKSRAVLGKDLPRVFTALDDVLTVEQVDALYELLRRQANWYEGYNHAARGLGMDGYSEARVCGQLRKC